jgi:hypothetical protein
MDTPAKIAVVTGAGTDEAQIRPSRIVKAPDFATGQD